jgi:hypothetical protein
LLWSPGDVHCVSAQQPMGHEVASQTHNPLTQRCPVVQLWPQDPPLPPLPLGDELQAAMVKVKHRATNA